MKRALLALALLLAACGPKSESAPEAAMMATEAAAPQMAADAYDSAAGGAAEKRAEAPSDAASGEQAGTPPGAPMLAYVYGATLEVPAKSVRATMGKHEAACNAAGPALCQVLGSSSNTYGDDQISANLQLRAAPKWLASFRGKLEGDAKEVGGRLKEQSVSSEDLTRQIVDTEARLRAQRTLRDRLEQILRTRPGKLQELLETERELARVQGEIDAAQSQLAVMRERVNMSVLNMGYQSKPSVVTSGTFEPASDAINDFGRMLATALGLIIRVVAFALPFVIIGAPIVWWVLRRRRVNRAKRIGGG